MLIKNTRATVYCCCCVRACAADSMATYISLYGIIHQFCSSALHEMDREYIELRAGREAGGEVVNEI